MSKAKNEVRALDNETRKADYQKKLQDAEAEYKEKVKQIHLDYAKSIRRYSVGDIIATDDRIIVVEKIGTHIGVYDTAEPVYIGTVLTKKLLPKKFVGEGRIYDSWNSWLVKRT